VIESGHSRFPVVGEDRDEVAGILLAKDLLALLRARGALAVRHPRVPATRGVHPESKRLNVLLKEFRVSHNHMAIVVDEYGGVSGLLTIEDVLEQIVGDIGDEYDVDEGEGIRKEGERAFTVPALTRIDEFNAAFGTRFSTRNSTPSADWCCTSWAACQGVARRSRSAGSTQGAARRPTPHRDAARHDAARHRPARRTD